MQSSVSRQAKTWDPILCTRSRGMLQEVTQNYGAPSPQQHLSKGNYQRRRSTGRPGLTSNTATSAWCCPVGPCARHRNVRELGTLLLSPPQAEGLCFPSSERTSMTIGTCYHVLLPPLMGRKRLFWLVNGKSPSIGPHMPGQDCYSESWRSLPVCPFCLFFSLDLHSLRKSESSSLHPAFSKPN